MMKTPCPDEEMLADYLEGRLSNGERSEIEEHLSDCEICLEDFMVTRSLVTSSEESGLQSVPSRVTQAAVSLVNSQGSISPGSLRERVKRSITGLHSRLSDLISLRPWGEWGLTPIRGSRTVVSKDLIHLKKTFKDVDTEIEIEKTGESRTLIRVKLPEDIRQGERIRVTLEKDEREISSHLLNRGYALFEDIPFGHYCLTFSRNSVTLGRYFFEIKESSNG